MGEPGIGKSRLVEWVSAVAGGRGFRVATGRCSQDDGAPTLWPWNQALRELARQDGDALDPAVERLLTGASSGDDEGAEHRAFSAWQALAHEVTSRAGERPVLLVLDDVHWADTATLKVLRHLVSAAGAGHHLAVLVTRRSWPEPSGALAEVGEEMARRHVTRLDLTGLTLEEARALVEDVAGRALPTEVVAEWHAPVRGQPLLPGRARTARRLGPRGRCDPAGDGARRHPASPGGPARADAVPAPAGRGARSAVLPGPAGRGGG